MFRLVTNINPPLGARNAVRNQPFDADLHVSDRAGGSALLRHPAVLRLHLASAQAA